jgi:hypothetical protein
LNSPALRSLIAQAVAKKAVLRMEHGQRDPLVHPDCYLKITIERKATGENVTIECFEGDRIDNYSVYCNGVRQGIQSISTLTKNIRKAIPRFRRMDDV